MSGAPLSGVPGRTLGRYELAFELASGGMATVYLARAKGPSGFEKVVALKHIHPHLAKERSFLDMFLDEARLASRINHPSVCSVFDFGEAEGSYYIAMEYILGETVSRLYKTLATQRGKPIEPRVIGLVCRIVAEACEGLHAAHELKGPDGELVHLVHRDISPQNLFIAYDGTVRVVDFGIARAEGRVHKTQTGAVKGKLAYMSPEQGRKLDLDRRSDIWAMGIVLWELLTGRRLFRRETDVDTILAVMNDEVRPPSTVRDGIPPELDALVVKALARDREDRWPDARKLGRALHRFLATAYDEPVMAPDVAEWMEALRGAKGQENRVVEVARRGDLAGPVERVADRALIDDSKSDVAVSGTRDIPPHTVPTLTVDLVDVEADEGPDPVETRGEKAEPPTSELPTDEIPIEGLPEAAADSPPTLIKPMAPASAATPRREGLLAIVAVVTLLVGAAVGGLWALGEREPEPAGSTNVQAASEQGAGDEGLASGELDPDDGSGSDEPGEEAGALVADEAPDPVAVDPAADDPTAVDPADGPATGAAPTPPEEPAPRTARRPPGRVNVATPGGWGDVYLGSRRLGRAPGQMTVPSGRRVLLVRPFGRLPAQRVVVNVPPRGSTRVVVPLSP